MICTDSHPPDYKNNPFSCFSFLIVAPKPVIFDSPLPIHKHTDNYFKISGSPPDLSDQFKFGKITYQLKSKNSKSTAPKEHTPAWI